MVHVCSLSLKLNYVLETTALFDWSQFEIDITSDLLPSLLVEALDVRVQPYQDLENVKARLVLRVTALTL